MATKRDNNKIAAPKNMNITKIKVLNYKKTRIIKNNKKMTNLSPFMELFKKKEKILSDFNLLLKSIKKNCC